MFQVLFLQQWLTEVLPHPFHCPISPQRTFTFPTSFSELRTCRTPSLEWPSQTLQEAALACPSGSSLAVPPPRPSWQNCPWFLPLVPTAPCTCLYLHSSHAITSICLSSCFPHQMVVPSIQGPNFNELGASCPQLPGDYNTTQLESTPHAGPSLAPWQNWAYFFSLLLGGPPVLHFWLLRNFLACMQQLQTQGVVKYYAQETKGER